MQNTWSNFGLSFILLFTLFGCNSLKEDYLEQHILCDVETSVEFLGKEYIEGNDGLLLTGGAFRSEDEAHSGKYSIKLGGSKNYAFQVKFKDVEKDMFVRATIWRKGNKGNLALTSLKNIGFQTYSKIINAKDSSGWEQLILESFIPANYNGEEIKLFAMNSSESESYFDDLEVKVYRKKPYPVYKDVANLELIIDQEYLDEINKNREKSFWKGVISKKTKKKYPAVLRYNGKDLNAEVRIKGDWLDHIQGDKLSFRIKLLEGNFNGMREFSIQQPGARGFMHEYVIHKIFLEEDVLTTNYGFVPVKVNDESRGIYAYEEHFAKHLVEARDRREGPIAKFDEDVLWKLNRENLYKKEGYISGPVVESSVINPFKAGKTTRNPVLKENFIIAQNLLNQYRMDSAPISELFKVDKLAKFYAIINLGRTWHSMRWHNERYYYDPLSSKIEIIAYDCYTASELNELKVQTTPEAIMATPSFDYDKYLAYSPFNDPVFARKYVEQMDTYMHSNRMDKILTKYESEIDDYTAMLKEEYSFYSYNKEFISDGVKSLKPKWAKVKADILGGYVNAVLKIEDYNYSSIPPIEGMSLQAFAASPYDLQVRNFYSQKLFLVAYKSKKLPEQGIVEFEEAIEFPAYKNLEGLTYKTVETAFVPSKIYFKRSIEDTVIYNSDAYNWPIPKQESPRQQLLKSAVSKSNSFCTVNDTIIEFKKGKHIFSEPLIISAGKKVIIGEGVHLDFIQKAFFMSFSPVYIIGNANENVKIESSDGSAMGFTIIDADKRSKFDHVEFKGFNTLAYNGWNLTGAVSFYQSDVDISNSLFLENHCEDALNIVRSDFSMSKTKIAYAYADGFDADFVSGTIDESFFENIGNDGIDFSGCKIEISNVQIDHVGDKGISGGESSTLKLNNIAVSHANIGVASKDRSSIKVENITIVDSYCAFAVYQKKSEYEPASMEVNNVEVNNIGRDNLLGLESILILDGKQETGIEKINIDSLYGF